VQNPIRLGDLSEPEPDVVLLKPDLDTSRIPQPPDVLLLVEVADATLAKDRTVKLSLYAQAGIPEVWIVALPEDTIEVYRQPDGQRYKQILLHNRNDALSIEALPDVEALPGAEILD
jgi:Uma2 family endonuclease